MRLAVRTSAPRTLTSNYRYNIAEYAGGMGVAQKHHATTAMTHERLNLQCSAPHRPPRTPMHTPRTPTARCGPLAGPSSRVPAETAVSASGGPSQALPSHHKRTAAPRWAQQRAHRSPHAPNYGIPRAGRTAPVTVRTPPARQHLDLDVCARCSGHEDLRSTTRYTGTRQGHAESVRARGSMPVGARDAGWTD